MIQWIDRRVMSAMSLRERIQYGSILYHVVHHRWSNWLANTVPDDIQ